MNGLIVLGSVLGEDPESGNLHPRNLLLRRRKPPGQMSGLGQPGPGELDLRRRRRDRIG